MKILAIRGSNLASLEGDFAIDFTTAPLADAGVFAISGPTGAGKSTLLDAVCLALYHDTPRLAAVSERSINVPDVGGETLTPRDVRSLMRRGAAEAHAEVDFVGRDGRRWRARWAVQRARKKPQAKLQKATASLEDLDSGQVVATLITDVRDAIEKRVGLSFEQFKRSVLLAQNDFAALLKAPMGERAALLEALTDTSIFARLSVLAHERRREEDKAVEELRARLQYIDVLSDEQRAELARDLVAADAAATAATDAQKSIVAEDHWHKGRQQAVDRLAQAKAAVEQLDSSIADQRDAFAELALHLALHPLVSEQARVAGLEKGIAAQQGHLKRIADALPKARVDAVQAKEGADQTMQAFEAAENARQAAQPALTQARALDKTLAGLAGQFETESKAIKKDQGRLNELEGHIARLAAAERKASDELRACLPAGEEPPALDADELAREQERVNGRVRDLALMGQRIEQWMQVQARHAATVAAQESAATLLASTRDQAEQSSAQLAQCDRERQASRIALERANLAADAVTQRLREALTPGQPCMVCGATDHPGAAHAAADAVLAELRRVDAAAEKALKSAQAREKKATGDLRSSEATLKAASDALAQIHGDLQAARAQLAKDKPRLEAALADKSEADIGAVLQTWQTQAQQTIENHQQRVRALVKARQAGQDLAQHRALRDGLALELEPRQDSARQIEARIQQLHTERQTTLGVENVDDYSTALDAAASAALKARDDAQGRVVKLEGALKQLEGQMATVWQKIKDDSDTLESERAHLSARLQSLQPQWGKRTPTLETLGERLAALPDDLEARATARDALLKQQQAAVVARDTHQATLNDMDAHPVSTRDQEAVAMALQAAEQATQAALENQSALRLRLQQDDQRREQSAEHQAAIRQREQAAQRWRTLADLIGSSDGAKFRGYAQQFTLDVLLDHANQHLDRLAPRYQLRRGGDNLSLLVVDRDFAEEVRSVHTLSGGESFLVSLALALGLASLSSEKVKVESLFIDEGFGSLDADTLNVAMEALDRLQADGRRVGVISHVHDMAERIGVQVRVEPVGAGRSRVVVAA